MKTYEESDELSHSDAEVTLGMRSILGIFFGLVLVCGVFFGFGYSLGRGNTDKAVTSARTVSPSLGATPSSAVKTVVEDSDPSSADTAENHRYASVAGPGGPTRKPAEALNPHKPSAAASAVPQVLNAANSTNVNTPNGAVVTKTSYSVPAPVGTIPPPASPVLGSAPAATTIMVQIAAVSQREDADVLVSALKKLGYSASVRSEPEDKLLHVQIGPFATRDEAKIVRTKLLDDGYNAILK